MLFRRPITTAQVLWLLWLTGSLIAVAPDHGSAGINTVPGTVTTLAGGGVRLSSDGDGGDAIFGGLSYLAVRCTDLSFRVRP